MKVYAIQSPSGKYINNRKWNCGYTNEKHCVDDVTQAKHYMKSGSCKGVVSRMITEYKNSIDYYNKQINNQATKSRATSYATDIARYEGFITRLESLIVVEVDVEKPNCLKDKTPDVKFNKYDTGFSTKKSQGNLYCKGCGIYFKQIPMLIFGKASRPARICPLCIQEHAHEAQKLLDSMDEDQRNNYEGERFIHRMG